VIHQAKLLKVAAQAMTPAILTVAKLIIEINKLAINSMGIKAHGVFIFNPFSVAHQTD
jgi:hypothetical protein